MIRINKDFNDVPDSLKPGLKSIFPKGVPDDSAKTHAVRKLMFRNKHYDKTADKCYRAQDVKDYIIKLYHGKCAYCEQRVEQFHVEHYRPKKPYSKDVHQKHDGYYWISLSWDNLLYSCPTCNSCKGNIFDTASGKHVTLIQSLNANINIWSLTYDKLEDPLLINPEREDPSGHFWYSIDGSVNAVEGDEKAEYTLNLCKLDRRKLNDARRSYLNSFIRRIRSIIADTGETEETKKALLKHEIKMFRREAFNPGNEFLEFRQQAICWLGLIIKQVKQGL